MDLPAKFGNYILLRKIAMGGMAEIFRAKTVGAEGFEKDLVIKRILPHYSEDEDFVKMFIDEAKVAAKLQHANIVQIYDFNVIDERYYIAMEYVEGKDLKRCVEVGIQQGTSLSAPQCVFVMTELAKALHYAHTKTHKGEALNIVHRDVSPHNAIISFAGEVKLMDFGIAKAASRSTKTVAGTVKGKCAYMSPEQARGKPLDGRSDLFALGIMLWEMLTHKRLFLGDSDFMTLSNVLKQEAPPPSSINPDVPPELDAIVLKSLAKDREERHPTCKEFGHDLTKWFYANVEDPDTIAVAKWMKDIFASDLAEVQQQLAQERTMFVGGAELKSASPAPAPLRGVSSPSVPLPAAPDAATISLSVDAHSAPTMLDDGMTAEQVRAAIAAQQRASQTGVPAATGTFQGAGTGTYGGPPAKSKAWIAWVMMLLVLLGGGGAAGWYFTLGPGAPKKPEGPVKLVEGGENPKGSKPGGDSRNPTGTEDATSPEGADAKSAQEPKAEVADAKPASASEVKAGQADAGSTAPEAAKAVAVKIRASSGNPVISVNGKDLGKGSVEYQGPEGQVAKIAAIPEGGGTPFWLEVTLKAGMPEVVLNLSAGTQPSIAAAAQLMITVDPPDVELKSTTGTVGKQASIFVVSGLKIGDVVTVTASKPGYTPESEDVAVTQAAQPMQLKLKKAGGDPTAQEDGFGVLFINARPWANVTVKGQSKGTTPVTLSSVPVGAYKVTFTKGSDSQSRTCHVKKGQRTTCLVEFN
jgi:serine/threonine protein kinase